uniref:Uncharacterized protein n=1 Tax=Pongo abelii TaxID=9601 RepID=A0A8I5TXM8_PONAB
MLNPTSPFLHCLREVLGNTLYTNFHCWGKRILEVMGRPQFVCIALITISLLFLVCAVAESQGIGLWIALVVFLSFLIFSPSFYILNAEQPFFKGPPTEPAKELK